MRAAVNDRCLDGCLTSAIAVVKGPFVEVAALEIVAKVVERSNPVAAQCDRMRAASRIRGDAHNRRATANRRGGEGDIDVTRHAGRERAATGVALCEVACLAPIDADTTDR